MKQDKSSGSLSYQSAYQSLIPSKAKTTRPYSQNNQSLDQIIKKANDIIVKSKQNTYTGRSENSDTIHHTDCSAILTTADSHQKHSMSINREAFKVSPFVTSTSPKTTDSKKSVDNAASLSSDKQTKSKTSLMTAEDTKVNEYTPQNHISEADYFFENFESLVKVIFHPSSQENHANNFSQSTNCSQNHQQSFSANQRDSNPSIIRSLLPVFDLVLKEEQNQTKVLHPKLPTSITNYATHTRTHSSIVNTSNTQPLFSQDSSNSYQQQYLIQQKQQQQQNLLQQQKQSQIILQQQSLYRSQQQQQQQQNQQKQQQPQLLAQQQQQPQLLAQQQQQQQQLQQQQLQQQPQIQYSNQQEQIQISERQQQPTPQTLQVTLENNCSYKTEQIPEQVNELGQYFKKPQVAKVKTQSGAHLPSHPPLPHSTKMNVSGYNTNHMNTQRLRYRHSLREKENTAETPANNNINSSISNSYVNSSQGQAAVMKNLSGTFFHTPNNHMTNPQMTYSNNLSQQFTGQQRQIEINNRAFNLNTSVNVNNQINSQSQMISPINQNNNNSTLNVAIPNNTNVNPQLSTLMNSANGNISAINYTSLQQNTMGFNRPRVDSSIGVEGSGRNNAFPPPSQKMRTSGSLHESNQNKQSQARSVNGYYNNVNVLSSSQGGNGVGGNNQRLSLQNSQSSGIPINKLANLLGGAQKISMQPNSNTPHLISNNSNIQQTISNVSTSSSNRLTSAPRPTPSYIYPKRVV